MPGREADKARYPTVEFLLHAVAGWINKHRVMDGVRDELGQCSPEEARQMANDLGVTVGDLRGLAAKGARAANALPKMLTALSVDSQALTDGDPAVVRNRAALTHRYEAGHAADCNGMSARMKPLAHVAFADDVSRTSKPEFKTSQIYRPPTKLALAWSARNGPNGSPVGLLQRKEPWPRLPTVHSKVNLVEGQQP